MRRQKVWVHVLLRVEMVVVMHMMRRRWRWEKMMVHGRMMRRGHGHWNATNPTAAIRVGPLSKVSRGTHILATHASTTRTAFDVASITFTVLFMKRGQEDETVEHAALFSQESKNCSGVHRTFFIHADRRHLQPKRCAKMRFASPLASLFAVTGGTAGAADGASAAYVPSAGCCFSSSVVAPVVADAVPVAASVDSVTLPLAAAVAGALSMALTGGGVSFLNLASNAIGLRAKMVFMANLRCFSC
jgi:hypothetical protein